MASLNAAFVIVELVELKPIKMVVIPAKWIQGLTLSKLMNVGLNAKCTRNFSKIFYHEDMSTNPNFRLETRLIFDKKTASCYRGKIKTNDPFGTCYVEKSC